MYDKYKMFIINPELELFFNNIKQDSHLPNYKNGELEEYIAKFACKGCGGGINCKKGEVKKIYNEADYLEINQENRQDDETEENKPENRQCKDCFWCGCPNCLTDIEYYDDADNYPKFKYDYRIKKLNGKLADVIKQSPIPVNEWANILSKFFIQQNFDWNSYKEIWRSHVFDINNKIYCGNNINYDELSDDDKKYFRNPSDVFAFAYNYNILRIMAGMSGLSYT